MGTIFDACPATERKLVRGTPSRDDRIQTSIRPGSTCIITSVPEVLAASPELARAPSTRRGRGAGPGAGPGTGQDWRTAGRVALRSSQRLREIRTAVPARI